MLRISSHSQSLPVKTFELVISLLKRADFKCMHLSFYYGKLGTFSHVRKTRNIDLIQGTENWTRNRDLRVETGGSKRKTGDRGRETRDRDVRQETVYRQTS